MPRNTGSRDLVFVVMTTPAGLKYGFRSGLRSGLRSQFGQEVVTSATPVANLVIGANSPKPARASKQETAGYESSFCAGSVVATLKADGWSITRPKRSRRAKTSGLARTQYITINSVRYAWNSPQLSGGATIDFAALGIETAMATTDSLIWGAEFPKPPRMMRDVAAGTGSGSFSVSSFVAPASVDTATTGGWIPANKGSGSYTSEDLTFLLG